MFLLREREDLEALQQIQPTFAFLIYMIFVIVIQYYLIDVFTAIIIIKFKQSVDSQTNIQKSRKEMKGTQVVYTDE